MRHVISFLLGKVRESGKVSAWDEHYEETLVLKSFSCRLNSQRRNWESKFSVQEMGTHARKGRGQKRAEEKVQPQGTTTAPTHPTKTIQDRNPSDVWWGFWVRKEQQYTGKLTLWIRKKMLLISEITQAIWPLDTYHRTSSPCGGWSQHGTAQDDQAYSPTSTRLEVDLYDRRCAALDKATFSSRQSPWRGWLLREMCWWCP